MLELKVRVHPARERTGIAVLRDGSRIHMEAPVAASATLALAARRGNRSCDPLRAWGHPPFGRYRLVHHVQTSAALQPEYGSHLFLFEPESGQALEAESFGRLALLAYGGPVGRDGRLRRTQGGLRLSEALMHSMLLRLRDAKEMILDLTPSRAPEWWRFWKRPDETTPLSATEPQMPSPPADEPSIIEELLMDPALVRRPRRERDGRRDSDDDRDERRRASSTDDSSSGRDRFEGGGGAGAGAGASGGWDSSPARGPGVDQTGRIVAGAAAAAGLAALADEAAATSSPDGIASDSDSPTTTSTAY